MTTHRFLRHRTMSCALTAAAVLLCAGLDPAAAQFPPPPGQTAAGSQSSPFPPPPGQQPQQQSSSPFPAPGQASAPAGGFGSPSGGFGAVQQGGFGVRPGGFSQPPPGMGPPGGGPSEAQKVCLTFPSIREEVEKGAAGIRAAGDRKATREEVCPLFKTFATKEAKLVKFLETNQRLCGVPPNIITQVKQNHAKTIQIRNTVCSAAPSAAGPTLSDALGGPIIADDTSVKTGRGTFDTLTGNALQR
jgi:hypothetical protein